MKNLRRIPQYRQSDPRILDRKPSFVFRLNDKMFERSEAFARRADAAHDHATKMNWYFKNNRVRES